MSDNIQLVRKDIDSICCIYRSVGEAMWDEPRDRLACRFAKRLDEKDTELTTLRGLLREAVEAPVLEEWFVRVEASLEGKP